MLQLSIGMHKKNPGYEVRAVVGFTKTGEIDEAYMENLKKMHEKLEHLIPGTFKPKFHVNSDGLVINVRAELASDAQRIQYKLDDFVKSAAMALKLK